MPRNRSRSLFVPAIAASAAALWSPRAAWSQEPAAAVPEAAAAYSPFKYGVDAYLGASNLPGSRGFTDGFWAGSAAAYPSIAYVRWENARGSAAKISLGTGRLYTAPDSALDQPVEAWWQTPLGAEVKLTIGQFWVPFGAQEWQYETKPGAMIGWTRGNWDLSVSGNYNKASRSVNLYGRVGRRFGENAGVGVSFGQGKGLSYGTIYDRAWALDGTITWRGWHLSAEYDRLSGGNGGTAAGERPFYFAYGKLAYENLGPWTPFLGRYVWEDHGSEAFGAFHSTVAGLSYRATPTLTIEGAYAPASQKNVTWLQLHWAWEH